MHQRPLNDVFKVISAGNKLSAFLPFASKILPSARANLLTAAALCTISHSTLRYLPLNLSLPVNHSLGTAKDKIGSPIVKACVRHVYQSTSSSDISSHLHVSVSGDQDPSSTSSNDGFLSPDYPRLESLQPALAAVRKACRITSMLQPNTASSEISGLLKTDSSPVTIADFSAQALILNILERNFKGDIFIAEEGSTVLEIQDKDLAISENNDDGVTSSLVDEMIRVLDTCGLSSYISTVDELKRSIDLGQTYQSNGDIMPGLENENMINRRWCLDPIDGTRGFLRGKREGGQYCVALALIENGVPVMGILGCPNLPASPNKENYEWTDNETEESNRYTRGCIFVASKGGGTHQLPLHPPSHTDPVVQVANEKIKGRVDKDASTVGAVRIHTTSNKGSTIPVNRARFCVGVETYGDPLGECRTIAKKIHGALKPSEDGGDIIYSRRMDSQVKYGILAMGGAEIFVRLPKKSYVEWIWDHAPGRIVIEEAGGIQTDTKGNLINYGLGAKMDPSVDGILASSGGVFHDSLLRAYSEVAKGR